MTTRTLDSDGLAKSTISNGQRKDNTSSHRDVLWNVVEPGDPYDIRKSMIANLPGKTKNFMGDNIQIVCLFQAAELQRLNQYLIEYRQQYLQLQRRELDRHSYQVQIKQLTERLAGEITLRNQNHKLQQHIKKLNTQIQDLHQRLRSSTGSSVDSGNYQNALSKIESLIQENNTLLYRNKGLQSDIFRLRYELQALEKSKLLDRSYQKNEYTTKISSSLQNQNKMLKSKYESQIYRLQKQNQRFSQSLQMKNHEISDLLSRLTSLEHQQSQGTSNNYEMDEMQNKVVLLAQQVDRLNEILRDKGQRYDGLLLERNSFNVNYSKINDESRRAHDENQRLKSIISGYQNQQLKTSFNQQTMDQLHNKLIQSVDQIQRLNSIIHNSNHERDNLKNDYHQLILQTNRVPILEKQNDDLKRRINEFDLDQRTLVEYQNKIALLSTEIERLGYVNGQQKDWEKQNQKLRQQNARLKVDINQIENSLNQKYLNQNDNLRKDFEKRIVDVEANTANRYFTQINETKSRYQLLVSRLSKDVDPDSQKKIQILVQEVDRLNQVLSRMKQDYNEIILRNGSLEALIPQLNEKDMILQSYQSRINDLDGRLRDLLGERVGVQTRMRSISQQNQNFKHNHNLVVQNQETLKRQNDDLRRQLALFGDYRNKIADNQNKIGQLTKENESLRHLFSNIENLQAQIDRLRNQNSHLINDLKQSENRIRSEYQQEIKKVQGHTSQRYITQISNITNLYEDKLNKLSQEVDPDGEKKVQYLMEELQRLDGVLVRLKEQNNDLIRDNHELRRHIEDQKQKDSLIKALEASLHIAEDQLRILQRESIEIQSAMRIENEQLKKQLGTSKNQEGIIKNLHQRIKSLEEQIRQRQGESIKANMRVRSLSEQNQTFKRNQDYTEKDINTLRKENQQMRNKMGELIKDLQKYKKQSEDIDYIRSQNSQYIQQISSLKHELASISQMLEQISRLEHQNSYLKKRIHEIQVLLAQKQSSLKKYITDLKNNQSQLIIARNNEKRQQEVLEKLTEELDRLNRILQKKNNETDEHMTRARSLSTENQRFKSTNIYLEKDRDQFKKEIDSLRKKIHELEISLGNANDKILLLNKQLDRLQEVAGHKQSIIKSKDIHIQQKISIIDSLRKEITESINSRAQIQMILRQYESKLSKTQNEWNISRNQTQLLKKKLEKLENDLQILRQQLRDYGRVKGQKNRLQLQIQKRDDDFNRQKQSWEHRHSALQKDNKYLDKKKKINDINSQDAIHKLTFLESEARRLKREKDSLFTKDISQLRQEIERLLADNMALKKYHEQLNIQIELKIRHYAQQLSKSQSERDIALRQLDKIKHDSTHSKSDYQLKIKSLSDTITMLNQNMRHLQQDGSANNKKYRQLVDELRDYEATLQNLVGEYKQLEAVLSRYKNQNIHLLDTASKYEKVRGDLTKAQSEKQSLNQNLRLINGILQKIRSQKDEIIRNNSDQQAKISQRYHSKYSHTIDQYKKVISELTKSNSYYKDQANELDRTKNSIEESNYRISQLSKQLSKIKSELNLSLEKQSKLQHNNIELKNKIEGYLSQIKRLESQKNDIYSNLDRKAQQAESCIRKFTQQNRELRLRLQKDRQMLKKIPDYERRIQQLAQLVDELTQSVSHGHKAQSSNGDRLRQAQQQNSRLQSIIDDLKRQIMGNDNSYKLAIDILHRENNDLKQYSSSVPQLGMKAQSLEAKMRQAGSEIDQLRLLIQAKDHQLLRVRKQHDTAIGMYESDKMSRIESYRKMQSQYNNLMREYDSIKRRAGESDDSVKKLYEQFNRLQQIIERLKKQRGSIIDKNMNLGRQYDKLLAINKRLQADIKQLRLEVADKITLQKRLQQQLALMVVLFAEIESMRSTLQRTQNQNQGLRKDSLIPFRL